MCGRIQLLTSAGSKAIQKIHPPLQHYAKQKCVNPFDHDLLPDVYREDASVVCSFYRGFQESLPVLILLPEAITKADGEDGKEAGVA